MLVMRLSQWQHCFDGQEDDLCDRARPVFLVNEAILLGMLMLIVVMVYMPIYLDVVLDLGRAVDMVTVQL